MELLPQLCLEPEDMIVTRRFAREESADHDRLDLPVRERGSDKLLLDAIHGISLPGSCASPRPLAMRLAPSICARVESGVGVERLVAINKM
jgi:hypothetical protein